MLSTFLLQNQLHSFKRDAMMLMEMTMKKTIREQFHKAALEAYKEHGFKSYRHAEQQTGVNYSTIYMIVSRGRIPTRGQVIEWAEGLNESVNEWLVLAGYEPIPVELCLQERYLCFYNE
jgi:hypothetical protein